jgi:hypothetical protein
MESQMEKHNKCKAKKKQYKEDNEMLKSECDKLNKVLYNNIQSYEKRIQDLKDSHEYELVDLKKREEEFMKSNENLMDTDIYTVYKDIKRKFEDKLRECLDFKDQNDKIVDENKIFKMNLDNSDNLIKECARVQMNQGKILKQVKEQLEEKQSSLERKKEENRKELNDLNFKLGKIIEDKDSEVKKYKNLLMMKSEENLQLRSLSQMILDQRSEIEQFFIESLEEVKAEVYRRKKELERKGSYFPNLSKKYDDKLQLNKENPTQMKKVNIKDLNPEDKEKVLRLVFSKINENYKPKSYKNIDLSRGDVTKPGESQEIAI